MAHSELHHPQAYKGKQDCSSWQWTYLHQDHSTDGDNDGDENEEAQALQVSLEVVEPLDNQGLEVAKELQQAHSVQAARRG
jgi:hypothetical protein